MEIMTSHYVTLIASITPQICCFIYIAMVANSNHFFTHDECFYMYANFPNFLLKASWIKIEILFFCANFAGIFVFTITLACMARCFKTR